LLFFSAVIVGLPQNGGQTGKMLISSIY